ncbi:MAG: DHA2 family efflux MFS transporter permease subunit [Ignavibacteriaceae bacterium]
MNDNNSNENNSAKPFNLGIPHHEHPSYKWWVLANVMIGTFMAVLDATIVDVALPKIMSTFGIPVDTAKWVATAYLLILAVMLPTSGWIADRFGYKKTYGAALTLFTVGSLLCSLSWNETALIMFRVVQGMGAGLLMPVGMAIVTREFPPEKRGVALGFWSIAAAASVSLGPTFGGYLIDNFAWHSIYDINVPIGIVAIFATIVIQREYQSQKIRKFDIGGFISLAVFLTSLLLALSDGTADWNTGGWTSTFILTCFTLAFASLVVFLVIEFNIREPLVDLRLLKNFNFGMSNLVLFIFGMGMFGSTFLLPLYLQNGLGFTAFQSGSLFLPIGFIQGIMAPLAGFLSDKVNPKIPAMIGIVLLAVSLFINHFLSLFSQTQSVMFSLYLRGLGMGFIFTPLSALALSEVPREKMAQASGLFNVLRQVGGSFGVAIMGTLLTDRTTFHLSNYGSSIDQSSPAVQNVLHDLKYFAVQSAGGSTSFSAMRAQALLALHVSQQAFVSAIDDDFFLAALITALCIVPVIFLRKIKKKKKVEKIIAAD